MCSIVSSVFTLSARSETSSGSSPVSSYCFSRSQHFRWEQYPSSQNDPPGVSLHIAISQKLPSNVSRFMVILLIPTLFALPDSVPEVNVYQRPAAYMACLMVPDRLPWLEKFFQERFLIIKHKIVRIHGHSTSVGFCSHSRIVF